MLSRSHRGVETMRYTIWNATYNHAVYSHDCATRNEAVIWLLRAEKWNDKLVQCGLPRLNKYEIREVQS